MCSVPRDGLRFSLETAQRDRIVNPSQDICQISNITLRDEDVVSVSGTASAARQPSMTGGAVVKLESATRRLWHRTPRMPAPASKRRRMRRSRTRSGGEFQREIAEGDVIVVPNGVPHWFKEVPGRSHTTS